MKKKIAIVIVIVLIIIAVLGIIINNSNKSIQINIEDLATKIAESGAFEDEIAKIDSEMIMSDYNITTDEVEGFVSYQGSGATSEEIVILKVKDKRNLNDVKDKINSRIQERKQAFQSYLPEEVGKIDNNILRVKGNYVIFCVSNDSSKVNQVINDYVK